MKSLLLTTSLLFCGLYLSAQVNNVDTTTNEPLNTAANIIKGNSSKNITIGSYAQIDYNQPIGGEFNQNGKLDIHRLILFLGYKFSDQVHFVSEIEFEHVSEVFIEQAFLNYRMVNAFNIRGGLMLVPMGIINEYHEPITYNGVERPNLDSKIVPTTWRELGFGFTGNFPSISLKYQTYVFNGFNGYDGQGKFRGTDALRKGLQKGAESYISSPNFSVKVDHYGIAGLKMGLSGYFGKSQSTLFNGLDLNDPVEVSQADSSIISIAMIGFDARYRNKGFEARAQVINATLANTQQYNSFTQKDLGSRLFGYYVEAGYDLLKLAKISTDKRLVLFSRYEKYNTHMEVAGELEKEGAFDRTDVTTGLSFHIAYGAVLKADYQVFKNEDPSTKSIKQLNFGIGIWF